jgi:hypothetical protein
MVLNVAQPRQPSKSQILRGLNGQEACDLIAHHSAQNVPGCRVTGAAASQLVRAVQVVCNVVIPNLGIALNAFAETLREDKSLMWKHRLK